MNQSVLLKRPNISFFLPLLLIMAIGCTGSRKIAKKRQKIDKVISAARSYTGTPYKWGGTTRGGLDCSALLMMSYRGAGFQIPRTTAKQSKFGKKIGIYDLRPGDMVFFKAKDKWSGKVTHAGLVTEIVDRHNVQFIHASTKLGVVENNIFSDYYQSIFVKARRPF